MNYGQSLQASYWLMLALQTINAVDMPGKGPRKLPAPKTYVATVVAWIGLDLAADAGFDRAAAAAGWVFVLTSLVVGSSGTVLTKFMKTIATTYSTTATSTDTSTSTPSTTENA